MNDILGTTLSELLSDKIPEKDDKDTATEILAAKAEEWFQEGLIMLKQGDFIKAAIRMGAAALACPDHIKAMNNLSVALANMGETEEAISVLNRVLAKDPSNATAIKNMNAITNMEE